MMTCIHSISIKQMIFKLYSLSIFEDQKLLKFSSFSLQSTNSNMNSIKLCESLLIKSIFISTRNVPSLAKHQH